MSPTGITSRRVLSGEGATTAILEAIRLEFVAAGFRVVEERPGERIRLRSGGFWRGTAANLLPVDVMGPLRSWQFDALVDAVRLDDGRVELSARRLLPRQFAIPVYEQALAKIGERLRAGGLAVEIGAELDT
ncbi:hypothetical protein ACWKWP_01760 [Agromyces soli]